MTPNEAPDGPALGRVLAVDDEPAVLRYVAHLLTREGYAVDTANCVDSAIIRLQEAEYDVVLVDLEMPVKNGLDLLAILAATESQVVPVLLTGTIDVGAAVAAMKYGAFDYLSKPASPNALRWTVSRALGVAQSRRRELALERVADEWAVTFDACPDLLLILDADGRVLRANAAATHRATGPAADRLVTELFPGRLGAAIAASVEALAEGRLPQPTTVYDVALAGHFLTSVTPIGPAAATVVVARDVTVLVRAEAARARLMRQLRTAQEDERGRISRELHDGVGQALVSLSLGLTMPIDAPGLAERLDRLRQVVVESLADVRRLAQSLRPTVLDDLGLEAALARLTELFTSIHGVRAELVVPESCTGRMRAEVESAAYRIVQEALANVAKHARARTVDVILEMGGGELRVSVADDGVGFATAERDGLGLTDMRERAEQLGGSFRVDSGPGRGTTVDVRIPASGGPPRSERGWCWPTTTRSCARPCGRSSTPKPTWKSSPRRAPGRTRWSVCARRSRASFAWICRCPAGAGRRRSSGPRRRRPARASWC